MRFYIRVIAVHGTSSFFLCSDAQFWVLRGTKKLESMLIEISRAKWNPKHAISVSESVITVEGLRFAQFLFIVLFLFTGQMYNKSGDKHHPTVILHKKVSVSECSSIGTKTVCMSVFGSSLKVSMMVLRCFNFPK